MQLLSCKMSSTNYGFVYAIQTREFLNTNTIKVGRTGDFIQRFKGYPKGSRIICVLYVDDYKLKEKLIINELKIKCDHQRKDVGTEYFEGSITTIVNVITNICCINPTEQKEEEKMVFVPKVSVQCMKRPDYMKLFIDIHTEKDGMAFTSLYTLFTTLKTWVCNDNIPLKIPTRPEFERYLMKTYHCTITRDYIKICHGLKLKNALSLD